MRDSLHLGCTPYGEDCAQVGSEGFMKRARAEARAYIGQLQRMFGEPPEGCSLVIRMCPHDFGSYPDVEAVFDTSNRSAVEYAYQCENKGPELWDADARQELGLAEV